MPDDVTQVVFSLYMPLLTYYMARNIGVELNLVVGKLTVCCKIIFRQHLADTCINKLILQYLKTRHCKYYTLVIVQYYSVKQKHTSTMPGSLD